MSYECNDEIEMIPFSVMISLAMLSLSSVNSAHPSLIFTRETAFSQVIFFGDGMILYFEVASVENSALLCRFISILYLSDADHGAYLQVILNVSSK